MWLNQQVSLYECAADNIGRVATLRDILLTWCCVPHRYYYKIYPDKIKQPKGRWVNGSTNDIDTIIKLREGVSGEEKTTFKQTMQCFTPSALLKTKKKNAVEVINSTGILQLDFDEKDICDYDVEELKQCVFSLSFIALCALSCGGKGFYAFALIAEPDKLEQYAEHCFNVLLKYGVKADTSKGRNVQDLRFVSWDGNMLIRPNPKPLQVKRFYSIKPATPATPSGKQITINTGNILVNSELKKLSSAQVGSRWATVQKVAYTLGGLGDNSLLESIKSVIDKNTAFTNEEDKYKQCAADCFNAGMSNPFIN